MTEPLTDVELDRIQIDRDRWIGRKSFRHFVEMAWPVIEPSREFMTNWHIDAMCDHLQAFGLSQIKELIFNVPPGSSKSSLCSVIFPAWLWTQDPSLKIVSASYSHRMVARDCIASRNLIASDWFSLRWGEKYLQDNPSARDSVVVSGGKDTQTEYKTSANGLRFGASVGTAATGAHFHVHLYDDLINARSVDFELAREGANRWIDGVMSTRWVDPKNQRTLLVMQRLHQNDPTGHLLNKGTYTHVCLPMEYEKKVYSSPIGFADPRTEEGELLWPARFDREAVDKLKANLGSYGAAGQLQQRPAPAGGGILKPEWFRRWTDKDLPPKFDRVSVTVDANFKEGKKSDNAAVGVWGDLGPRSYLLEMLPLKAYSYVNLKKALRDLADRYTTCTTCSLAISSCSCDPEFAADECAIKCWRIEAAANGHALISELSQELQGVIPFKPAEYGSKVARAEAASPQIESGNVFIPADAPWAGAYLMEMESFPNGDHDDQVDMTTMYLLTKKRGFRTDFLLPNTQEDDAKGYSEELGADTARPMWGIG